MHDYMNKKETAGVDICLVMPPTSFSIGPSLALGLLKAEAVEGGLTCAVDYADMYFANAVGPKFALDFCQGNMMDFLGEFIFAESAGIETVCGMKEIEEKYRTQMDSLSLYEEMNLVRHGCQIAKEQVEKTARRIIEKNPKIVGVSSSFHQRNSALAICKRIKELRPDVITMMGGANCFGQAGLGILKKFKFIDYVFFGESDDIFSSVCRMAIDKSEDELPYGVIRNGDKIPETAPHRIVTDLDLLPYPDFDEFFEMISSDNRNTWIFRASQSGRSPITLYMEASRGCWWGEKHSCSFCGLNGKIKTYRRKSAKRVFDELTYLTEKYGTYNVYFTDCIMPREWFDDFIPLIKASGKKISIFTELKSNLTPAQIETLADAGINYIQPGIESLSSHSLRLMGKGVSAQQNLAFLKYGRKNKMTISWNILYGFPGETVEDYDIHMKLIPLIEHLTPPNSCAWIVYARDSEYVNNPEKYSLKLKPAGIYRFMCPDDEEYITDIAIYYDAVNELSDEIKDAAVKLNALAREWIGKYNDVSGHIRLDYANDGDRLTVVDTRSCAPVRLQYLTGAEKDVYLLCNTAVTGDYIFEMLRGRYSADMLNDAVFSLIRKKLLIRYENTFFALAIEYSPDELKKREADDLRYFLSKNEKLRADINREVKAETDKGRTLEEATKHAISQCIEKLGMYLSADIYMDDDDYE